MSLAADAANLDLWIWNIPGDDLRVTEKWRKVFGRADFFVFQAEGGIRVLPVTGVQTCALPISPACSGFPPAWWTPRSFSMRSPPPRGATACSRLSASSPRPACARKAPRPRAPSESDTSEIGRAHV